ncbi:MAG: hypothetical protein ACRCT6_05985, partial [Notoacmeibacter sp.]
MTEGYSSTPLAKKLGFSGKVYAHQVPETVIDEIALAQDVEWVCKMRGADDAHLFLTLRKEL